MPVVVVILTGGSAICRFCNKSGFLFFVGGDVLPPPLKFQTRTPLTGTLPLTIQSPPPPKLSLYSVRPPRDIF